MKYLRIKRSLPDLHIEADRLLSIIKLIAGSQHEVTGRSWGRTYKNIDEMKAGLEYGFENCPVIQIGPVTFNAFHAGDNSRFAELSIEEEQLKEMRLESGAVFEQALLLLDSLEAELIRHKSRFVSMKYLLLNLMSPIKGRSAVFHRAIFNRFSEAS